MVALAIFSHLDTSRICWNELRYEFYSPSEKYSTFKFAYTCISKKEWMDTNIGLVKFNISGRYMEYLIVEFFRILSFNT